MKISQQPPAGSWVWRFGAREAAKQIEKTKTHNPRMSTGCQCLGGTTVKSARREGLAGQQEGWRERKQHTG